MDLSKKRVPLKALVLLLIFSLGSITVSGTILPFTVSDAHKITGSFVLTISPSAISVPQGMNATSTVTILSTEGFTGTVSLTAQVTNGSILVTFNPIRVNVPLGRTTTSTVSVQAATNAAIGAYSIIITGTNVAGRKTLSSSAILTATVSSQADFGVYTNPDSVTVVAGSVNSTSSIVTSKNGFDGSVSLSATVPFGFLGVMGGQNPVRLTPGATTNSSLQVSATTSTTLGRYNITITGSSGNISHSCILTVNVVGPAPESLTLSGYSLNAPTSLTLSLLNSGSAPTTLQSYSVTDISGDAWTLANWTGPTISPGSTNPVVILIGSSCNTCTYRGITGLFQEFVVGHTYTITVTTKLYNQFAFTVAI